MELSELCPMCKSWRWCGRPCKWRPEHEAMRVGAPLVTKIAAGVTENGAAASNIVTGRPRGRPKTGLAMTAAERQRRSREKRKGTVAV
jgi:hypothetical protein